MSEARLRRCGERALLAEIGGGHGAVHRAAAAVRAALGADAEEVVPGDRTLLVIGRERAPDAGRLQSVIDAARDDVETAEREPIEIAVRYDGADLDEVAALTGLTREEVVRRHAAPLYLVAFVGFAPGFAYLVGGDELLAVPRRDAPRERVPAGSVAIAGPYSAIYPSASPGGWRLLGTSDAALFDAHAPSPALLSAGDRVRFRELA